MLFTNIGRSVLVAGNKKILPGAHLELEAVSDKELAAFKYFAARGLLKISGLVEEEPVVIDAAPEHEVAIPEEEATAEEVAEVVAEPVVETTESSAPSKKRRARK